MGIKKTIKNIFRKTVNIIEMQQHAERGVSPDKEYMVGRTVEPNEHHTFVFQDVKEKDKNITVSNAIRRYVAANSTLRSVVEIYQQLLIKQYAWTGSERNTQRIEEFIEKDMFKNVHSFRSFIKRAIYFYVAEIGVAIKTNYKINADTGEMQPEWELIPSLDLIFTYKNEQGEHDPRNGTILIVGRRMKNQEDVNRRDALYDSNKIEVLFDESKTAVENMNFTYLPAGAIGDKIFGTSRIAGLLNPVLSKKRLSDMLGEYLDKKIDPNTMIAADMRDLFARDDVEVKDVMDLATAGSEQIKKQKDNREIGETLVIPFPIETHDVSGVTKDKLDGIEPILDLYEPEILRASGVPGFMLGGQRKTMALNQNDSNSSMLMFGRRLEQGVLDFNEVFTEALVPIRVFLGIDEECSFKAQYDDTEIQKIRAEIALVKIDVFDKAIKSGLITQEQGIEMLTTDTFDFTTLHGQSIPEEVEPESNQGGEEDA